MYHVLVPEYHLAELRERNARERRFQEHARVLLDAKQRHRYRPRRRR